MIIKYESKYSEDVKDLLVELQEYIVSIDREKYNIITPEYREKYFIEAIEEVNKNNGQILLAKEENKIVGLVIGLIIKPINEYAFKAPKRGRISELIITQKYRKNKMGGLLLESMEEYLRVNGCEDILIEVFGYNDLAIKFYDKHGYNTRLLEVTKKIKGKE
ncbi:MAG: GNAT family N-acetyltransferase [Bacilli bacterium]|nr:GNAT family N-acetyltransferase [Bacilli bacterium]